MNPDTSTVVASWEQPPDSPNAMLQLPHRTKLQILGAVLLGLFLATLDQTVVSTALPRIVTDLKGLELYTWVSTAYLLTSTISIPFYGKLSDLYGRKPLLIGGISLFLLGSVLAGLSQEMWQLVLFRGIQGLGGGALFPLTLAVIGDMFEPAERAKYQGLGGAIFGISALVGPALGGFITESASWRWVFYVNLPIGIAALALVWRLMPGARRTAVHQLDYAGGAVFAASISLVLVGLTNMRTNDWTDVAVAGLLGAGLALSGLFVAIESRAAEPIVPLHLFRNRTYAVAIAASFVLAFAFFTAIAFLPLWFQVVRGASPTQSGYQILAYLAGVIASSVVSGIIVSRTGTYRVLFLASILLTLVGLWSMTHLQATTDLPVVWAWMFITGVGMGPSLSVLMLAAQNAVDERDMGVATSSQMFFRQVGGTVALALAGTIFSASLRLEIPAQLAAAGVPARIVAGFAGGGFDLNQLRGAGVDLGRQILAAVPEQLRAVVEPVIPNIVAGIHQAISLAIADTFVFAALMTIAGLGVAILLPEARRGRAGVPAAAARGAAGRAAAGNPGLAARLATEEVMAVD
jgi:EmrB/QacA subfamily drug resistance transporter